MEEIDNIGEILRDGDDENSVLDELNIGLDILENKIHASVEDIPGAILNSQDVLAFEKASQMLGNKLDLLIGSILESNKEKQEKLVQFEKKCNQLQAELKIFEEQHERDQADIYRLKSQIMSQADYISKIGSVFGIVVWRASHNPEMINNWISYQSEVEEFLSIADRIIMAFFKTYGAILPPERKEEHRYAMGLLGTVSNMAANSLGRQFIIENTNGKSLVKNLVISLPSVPTATGKSLKKIILLILWNISVNKSGLEYLFDLHIGQVIVHCLDDANAETLQLFGLKLFESITYNLEKPRLLDDLFECVPIEKIERLANEGRNKNATLAQKLLHHFTNYKKPILGRTGETSS